MSPITIPISRPDLSGNEEAYLLEALRSTWISSSGPFVSRFETEFAEVCNSSTALAVSNGTVALHIAMLGLDVRQGDEVIVPSLTYVATANAARYVGAEPVFADVDPKTWCIDPGSIERSITSRTRGIIAVHLYGHPCDMDAINRIAAVHGLWVVEDAAEAHFARYKGRAVGGLGKIGTFSFYGNKILTCGEGGAVVVNDDMLALRLRMLRGQGMDPERRYYHPITGYNFRLTNIACAILCAQLERSKHFIDERNKLCELYRFNLNDRAPALTVEFQEAATWAEPAPWMMCVLFDGVDTRRRVEAALDSHGIETRPLFVPLHRLPPFREMSMRRREELPITDDISSRGLCLPTYVGLSEEQIGMICDRISKAM